MRIDCPSCAAVYDFDDQAVGPEGITLRCTSCGHTFRFAPLVGVSGMRVRRTRSGEVVSVRDELDVRGGILERRFGRGDLLSRSGQHWAALGELPEFAAYFHVSDEMGPTRPSGPLPQHTPRAPGDTADLPAVGPAAGNATQWAHAPATTPPGYVQADGDTGRQPNAATRRPHTPPPLPSAPAVTGRPRLDTGKLRAQRAAKQGGWTIGSESVSTDATGGWDVGTGPVQRRGEPGRMLDTEQVIAAGVRSGPSGAVLAMLAAVGMLGAGALAIYFVPDLRARVLPSSAESAPAAPAPVEAGAEPSAEPTAPVLPPTEASGATTAAAGGVAAGADVPNAAPTGATDTATPPAEPAAASPPAVAAPTAPAAAQPAPPPPAPVAVGRDSLDVALRRGSDALAAGRYDDALAIYADAAERFGRAEAHVGAARAYLELGRRELAALRYERAIEANNRYQPAWVELGEVRQRMGDTAGAREAWERVLAIRSSGSAADRARAGLAELGPP